MTDTKGELRKSGNNLKTSNSSVDSQHSDAASAATCLTCCDPIEYYAVGVCNHREVCSMCALRLRVLYDDKECCICKAVLKDLVFTKNSTKPYELFNIEILLHDRALDIYFEDGQYMKEIKGLMSTTCSVCKEFSPNIEHLKKHVKKEHGLAFCDICVGDRKVFVTEQTLFEPSDLARHMLEYDGGASESTKPRGHPLCEFCNRRCYGNDQLFEHMSKNHFTCHICERNNILYQYYKDYRSLERHFDAEHFLCRNPECLERKFVVFNSTIDLKGHELSAHSGKKTKADRALEVNFTVRRVGRNGEGVDFDDYNGSYRPRPARREEAVEVVERPVEREMFPQLPQPSAVLDQPSRRKDANKRGPKKPSSVKKESKKNMSDEEVKPKKVLSGRASHSDEDVSAEPPRTSPRYVNPAPPEEPASPSNPTRAPVAFSPGFVSSTQTEESGPSQQETKERNKRFIEMLKATLGDSRFEEFRKISGDYRSGKMPARDYYNRFVDMVGKRANELFPDLVGLLPDPDKRAALSRIHEEYSLWEALYPSLSSETAASRPAAVSRSPSGGLDFMEKYKKNQQKVDSFKKQQPASVWDKKKLKIAPPTSYVCPMCGDTIVATDRDKHVLFHKREQDMIRETEDMQLRHAIALSMKGDTSKPAPTWSTKSSDFPSLSSGPAPEKETVRPGLAPSGKKNWSSTERFQESDFPSLGGGSSNNNQYNNHVSNTTTSERSDQYADAYDDGYQEQGRQQEETTKRSQKKNKKQVLIHFG